MDDLRKAAEMALVALCSSNPIGHALEDYEYHNKATEALRQALAQPEQEKMCVSCGKPTMNMGNKCYGCCQTAQTDQKPWVGLTDDEVTEYSSWLSGRNVVKAIEQRLKEKNT